MNRHLTSAVDRFEELYDRDIETLISGGTPANTDLMPLRVFIAELGAMADHPIDDAFIEFHAAEAAAAAASAHAASPIRTPGRGRARWTGLRRRVTATAISLTMLLGATGAAWAADGAAPGDWYYGLDRALEAFGIGAGGPAERAIEMASLNSEGSPGSKGSPTGTNERDPGAVAPDAGLGRAETVVSQPSPGGGSSAETRSRVSGLLRYLDETERVDGAVVSKTAKEGAGRPEGAPEDKGSPGNEPAGEKGGQGGKPAEPGKGSPPESPGRSARP